MPYLGKITQERDSYWFQPMKDLRIKNERRSFKPAPRFPFLDSEGDVTHVDRRRVPDRRLNSICLEVVPMEIITAEGGTA